MWWWLNSVHLSSRHLSIAIEPRKCQHSPLHKLGSSYSNETNSRISTCPNGRKPLPPLEAFPSSDCPHPSGSLSPHGGHFPHISRES